MKACHLPRFSVLSKFIDNYKQGKPRLIVTTSAYDTYIYIKCSVILKYMYTKY